MAPTAQIHSGSLSDFMVKEGLRLTDLSKETGLSMGYLSNLCSGQRTRVSPATAKKLADALKVRISAITVPEAA